MTEGHQCNKCKRFFATYTYAFAETLAERKQRKGIIMEMNPRVAGMPHNKTYCLGCSVKVMKVLDRFDSGELE